MSIRLINRLFGLFLVFTVILGSGCKNNKEKPHSITSDSSLSQRTLQDTQNPQRATQDKPHEPEKFTFTIDKDDYQVLSNGKGATRRLDDKSIFFILPLGESDWISELYYAKYDGDIIFIFQAGDGDTGVGAVVRLDGRSLALKWKAVIPGFNIGEALIDSGYLYLTSIGFVGKLNLKSGDYIWKHDELYRRPGVYNAFYRPRIMGNRVFFPENRWQGVQGAPLTLEIDNASGKIISGAPPSQLKDSSS